MTAGRKPMTSGIASAAETLPESTIAAIHQDMRDAAALPATLAAMEKDTKALAKTLGYEGPLAPDQLEEGARESLVRISFEIFSVGARLLLLKAQCPHGEFMERLERLEIEESMARRLMQATRKFPNRAISHDLASLGKSKIFELVVLDDEEAEAFANGEEVRGITRDDAYTMSVSELRAALRKERADKEAEIDKVKAATSGQLAAKDKIIADKSKLISDLVTEKIRRDGLTDSELAVELERDLTDAMLLASGSTIPLRKAVDAIRGLDHVPQGLYVAMQGAIHRVLSEVESIADDYGISLDFGLPTAGKDDPLAGLDELDDPNAEEDFDAAP